MGEARGRKGYRGDIQGLRAFAVISVILNHLFGWPAGGFVGVDMFFVISGFLITGLLLREWEKTERISFVGFYARRIRRIVPGAVAVVAATCGAALLLFSGSRAHTVFIDSVCAVFFSANWRFAAEGTNYFDLGQAPSPVEHYWSLSVEEQFYFVWPWLMLCILMVLWKLRVRRRWDRRVAALTMVVIVALSVAWAWSQSVTSPVESYYSSLTRAWELGLGALLSCIAPVLTRIPRTVRPYLTWLGLAGMVSSLFVIDSTTTWPAPGAILPVVATALVIVAGTGAAAKGNWLLTNGVSRYIGNISYSLYLWHFPVIVFAAAVMVTSGAKYNGTVLVITAIVSVVSYHALEYPINHSPLLVRFHGDRRKRQSAWRSWWEDSQIPMIAGGMTCLLALTGGMVVMSASKGEVEAPREVVAAGAPTAPVKAADPYAADIRNGLIQALNAATWPTLDPAVEELPSAGDANRVLPECGSSWHDDDQCSFGDPHDPEVVVFGDSLGEALMPTVRTALSDRFHVKGLIQFDCVVTDLSVRWHSEKEKTPCLSMRKAAFQYIRENRPDVVLVTQNYAWAKRLTNPASGRELKKVWRAADDALVEKLAPYTKRIAFVSSTVDSKSITTCATKLSDPADCISEVSPAFAAIHDVEEDGVDGADFVDTWRWFCVDGRCPAFRGDTPILIDGTHPSVQYSTAPLIVKDFVFQLQQIGVITSGGAEAHTSSGRPKPGGGSA